MRINKRCKMDYKLYLDEIEHEFDKIQPDILETITKEIYEYLEYSKDIDPEIILYNQLGDLKYYNCYASGMSVKGIRDKIITDLKEEVKIPAAKREELQNKKDFLVKEMVPLLVSNNTYRNKFNSLPHIFCLVIWKLYLLTIIH